MKTTHLCLMLAQYLLHFPKSKGLYLRQSYPSLRSPFEKAQDIYAALGYAVDVNQTEMSITFRANGSQLVFAPLPNRQYFDERHRGSEYQILAIDEAATWPLWSVPALAISLLRHATYPTRILIASNPGIGGTFLLKAFIEPARKANSPVIRVPELGDREFYVHRMKAEDNPFLDIAAYEANLKATYGAGTAAYEANRHGLFDSVEGGLFTLTDAALVQWKRFLPQNYPHLRYSIGYDHGGVAPYAAVWLAEVMDEFPCPDGRVYPRGSVIAYAESTNASEGTGYAKAIEPATVADVARQLYADAEVLGHPAIPKVHADTQLFARVGSAAAPHLASEMRQYGITVVPANKGRIADNVSRTRELLAAAGSEIPGLYIDESSCPYLLQAIAGAPADHRDPNVLDAKYPLKHGLDALFYGLAQGNAGTVSVTHGMPWEQPSSIPSDAAIRRSIERERRSRMVAGKCRRF